MAILSLIFYIPGTFYEPSLAALKVAGLQIAEMSTFTMEQLNGPIWATMFNNSGVLDWWTFTGRDPFYGATVPEHRNIVLCWTGNTELTSHSSLTPPVAAGEPLKQDRVPYSLSPLSHTTEAAVCRYAAVQSPCFPGIRISRLCCG